MKSQCDVLLGVRQCSVEEESAGVIARDALIGTIVCVGVLIVCVDVTRL